MYERHFALRSQPFSLTPDPDFLFLSRGHAEALAALEIGLTSRRGLVLMTGEVGTGKTTLLYALLQRLRAEMHIAYVSNTRLPFRDILRQLVADFGIACDGTDQVAVHAALNRFLLRCASEGTIAAVVIDEAQNLDDDAFENLRLLSNFETFTTKLIQIVLVGQPEIDARLRRPALRQVAERIAVRCHINPLSRVEARQYIHHRLERAGGTPALFTRAALGAILRRARGIPRRMNILCDNALLFAYGRGLPRVTRACVRAASRSRDGRALVVLAPQARRAPHVSGPASARSGRSLRAPFAAAAGGALAGAAIVAAATTGLPAGWPGRSGPPAALRESDAPAPRDVAGAAADIAPAEHPPAADAPPFPDVARADASDTPAPDDRIAARAPDLEPSAPMAPPVPDAPRPDCELVRVEPGTNLESLARRVYGAVDADLLRRIQLANPQIVNPNRILVGDTLRFPNPPDSPRGGNHE